MSVLHTKELKQDARRAMENASYPPKQLALIHAAVSATVLLLGMLVTYGLSVFSNDTGGLSGMGLRAILSTADSTLSLVSTVFLAFWELGIAYACLKIHRNEDAGIPALTQGLRRFGPLLRLYLLQVLVYCAVIFFAVQIASVVFMLLPGFEELVVLFEEFATAETMDDAMIFAIFEKALPLYAIVAVLCVGLITPISYRLRMAQYLILDGKTDQATAAISGSFAMMRGNCWAFFKIDLSFWWYYALGFVLAIVSSGDMILDLLKISLPFGSVLFYSLYLAGLVLLAWGAAAYVQTTYGCAYDALNRQAEAAAKPAAIASPGGKLSSDSETDEECGQ